MILVIDVGNSFVKCAVFETDMLIERQVCEHNEAIIFFNFFLKKYPQITNGIVSSVGKLENDVLYYLKENINLLEISNETIFPFINNYQTPKTLGIDRMVLVAGAVLSYPNSNRLIIDAGTCITYDFVDSKNIYYGGSISPGISLRYKSLNTYTQNLPLLHKKEVDSLTGSSTTNAIHTGVINGVVFEIDGFIAQYLNQNKDLTIILTGGDADFLAKSLKNTIFANSNFLLESLNQLYTYSKKKND
uniref:type III pantothenate kinase n=1 Tax=Flavobacterium sp. TaxID=239 RepID=UPI0040492E50